MLIIRILGMASNIYISSRAGASSMGIYHMIFSVFTFGITFAASGTGFAVTRLISEEAADAVSVIKKCLVISSVASFVAFLFFFFGAPFLSTHFIKDKGSAYAIRILAFALPFMGASTVYRGYFIAKRQAVIITASSLLEEAASIFTTIILLNSKVLKNTYMCLIYGCALSNLTAFIFDTIAIRISLKNNASIFKKALFKDILSICVPIALGSYLRTGLVAIENLMIPLQFEKYGTPNPVGEYGVIKAMAMPILLFPTVFIQAFSSMLVPEMSEMNARKRPNGIRHVATLSLNTTTMFSFFIAFMLFKHHKLIGESFFKEPRVPFYLGLLSLLSIPMYLDTVADSILKGLNLQNASLKYNIIDSSLRICAIFLIMQHKGPVFYIAMLYISEIFNLSLSLNKAAKTTGLRIDFTSLFIIPLISSILALFFSSPFIEALIYICVYFSLSKLKKETLVKC